MDKTQKVIVVLLVIAILFSAMSILFSLTNNTLVDSPNGSGGNENYGGNVALVVEPQGSVESDGGDNGSE